MKKSGRKHKELLLGLAGNQSCESIKSRPAEPTLEDVSIAKLETKEIIKGLISSAFDD